MKHLGILFLLLLLLPGSLWAQNGKKRVILPEALHEVSGLVVGAPDSLWWHNDGGSLPVLYLTDRAGRLLRADTLAGTRNVDWEDLTTDRQCTLYVGDFGNNLGHRTRFSIYSYRPATQTVDSILFTYPGQDGSGRAKQGNYDTEAFFFANDSLHLFTKDLLPSSQFLTRHFVVPAQPGQYVAQLRDSLVLRKRVVTAAAIDSEGNVAITAYYFHFWLGFLPMSAATVYLFTDYPAGQYLQGRLHKRKLSCLFPTQYESVDFWRDYLLTATERTPLNRQKMKRKKQPKR